MASAVKRIIPLLDRVLVQRAEPITKTKSGLMLPEKAAEKVQKATVVAVGPGQRNEKGEFVPLAVRVGDEVLLPQYGGTRVEVESEESKEFHLFRESDILAKIQG